MFAICVDLIFGNKFDSLEFSLPSLLLSSLLSSSSLSLLFLSKSVVKIVEAKERIVVVDVGFDVVVDVVVDAVVVNGATLFNFLFFFFLDFKVAAFVVCISNVSKVDFNFGDVVVK